MSMLDVLGPIGTIINKVLDKFLPSDLDKATADKAKAEANAMLVSTALEEDNEFRKFILEYEGRASDLSPVMSGFRASLRPVVSYAVYITDVVLVWKGLDIPTLMVNLTYIVTVFWFGERALKNVAPALKDLLQRGDK